MLLQLEVVIVLLESNDFAPGWIARAVGIAILVREKSFLLHREITFVLSFIEMTFSVELREQCLDDLLVAWLGRAHKIVVGESELFRKRTPTSGEFIAVLLRLLAFSERGLLDFLTMLVEACKKKNFFTEQSS